MLVVKCSSLLSAYFFIKLSILSRLYRSSISGKLPSYMINIGHDPKTRDKIVNRVEKLRDQLHTFSSLLVDSFGCLVCLFVGPSYSILAL